MKGKGGKGDAQLYGSFSLGSKLLRTQEFLGFLRRKVRIIMKAFQFTIMLSGGHTLV